jgi:hypothetical protein
MRPSLSIGADGTDPDYLFGSVDDALLVGEFLIVLDAQGEVVTAYDREGRYVHRVARPGGGPGEVRGPEFLVRYASDEFFVVEPSPGRAHRFRDSGEFLGTVDLARRIELPLVVDTSGLLYARPNQRISQSLWEGSPGSLAVMETGGEVVAAPQAIGVMTSGQFDATPASTVRWSITGTVVDTIDIPFDSELSLYFEVISGGQVHVSFEYQPRSWWEWTTHGELLMGRTDSPVIEILSGPDLGDRDTLRVPGPPIDIMDAERAALKRLVDQLSGNAEPKGWLARTSGELFTHKPFYRRVITLADGGYWVALHVPSVEAPAGSTDRLGYEPGTEYLTVSPDGVVLGRITGPANVRVLDVVGDTVLARVTDALDVQSLGLFVIEWDDGGRP